MTNHRIFPARPHRALAALTGALAIVAASLAAATPASAATIGPACNYDFVTFNACLVLGDRGFGWWDAEPAVDVNMPEQYAREIVACGANFRASLWGKDSGYDDDLISNLVLKPGWPAAGPTGLGAEFTVPVTSQQLDEDDGEDEVYARISFVDCHTGATRQFRTGTIVRYF
jgi:hypothetical protein